MTRDSQASSLAFLVSMGCPIGGFEVGLLQNTKTPFWSKNKNEEKALWFGDCTVRSVRWRNQMKRKRETIETLLKPLKRPLKKPIKPYKALGFLELFVLSHPNWPPEPADVHQGHVSRDVIWMRRGRRRMPVRGPERSFFFGVLCLLCLLCVFCGCFVCALRTLKCVVTFKT